MEATTDDKLIGKPFRIHNRFFIHASLSNSYTSGGALNYSNHRPGFFYRTMVEPIILCISGRGEETESLFQQCNTQCCLSFFSSLAPQMVFIRVANAFPPPDKITTANDNDELIYEVDHLLFQFDFRGDVG